MDKLSRDEIRSCIHPRFAWRYGLAIFCTILLIPILIFLTALSAVTLILLWIIAIIWIGAEVTYHYMVDNSILVSELNYPRIFALTEEVRQRIGVRKDIHIFVYEHGAFNAALTRLFRRRAIFLNSEVLEAGVADDEVRWLVGRFVGYLRVVQDTGIVGRLVRITERSGIFTLAVFPYSRAMVYTGDRLGLAAINGNIEAAISTMQKLLVGRQLGYSVNPIGVIEQRRQTKGSLFAFFARMSLPFPSTIARYVDLISFAKARYPAAFERFEAATSGLPEELHLLSAERTSASSVLKGIGFAAMLAFAALVTLKVWSTGLYFLLQSSGLTSAATDASYSERDAGIYTDEAGLNLEESFDDNMVSVEPAEGD